MATNESVFVLIERGLAALRSAERFVRDARQVDPSPPVHELAGLIGRLSDGSAEEWRSGAMRSFLSPADLIVLSEWSDFVLRASPYAEVECETADIIALQAHLRDYIRSGE